MFGVCSVLHAVIQLPGWGYGAGIAGAAKLCPGSRLLRSVVRKTDRLCHNVGELKTQVYTLFLVATPDEIHTLLCRSLSSPFYSSWWTCRLFGPLSTIKHMIVAT